MQQFTLEPENQLINVLSIWQGPKQKPTEPEGSPQICWGFVWMRVLMSDRKSFPSVIKKMRQFVVFFVAGADLWAQLVY